MNICNYHIAATMFGLNISIRSIFLANLYMILYLISTFKHEDFASNAEQTILNTIN